MDVLQASSLIKMNVDAKGNQVPFNVACASDDFGGVRQKELVSPG